MYVDCMCTNCNTEDYGLEILFLECWSRASEMDFFEVQCDTHTPSVVLPYVYMYMYMLD